MLITLSPAKILDFKSPASISESSVPLFKKEAKDINNILKSLSVEEVAALMKINSKQAIEVYQHIHTFDMDKTSEKQAIFTYNGIAFQGLDADTLNPEGLAFAQNNLVILSGLYGILRPLDMIKPYRLELQTNIENQRGKTLYDYWSETVTKYVGKQMKDDDNTWINLSSNEYSKAINKKGLPKNNRVITPVFKEQKGNNYQQVTVYAKKARGMMARFIIQNQISDIEYIKAFDSEGYCFSPQLSGKDEWVFIR